MTGSSEAERQASVTEVAKRPLAHMLDGKARAQAILLLAGVLGLDAADKGSIGAIAPQLKHALDISNIQIGLLVTVSTLVGALATLPLGILVDRIHRKRLLVVAIAVWSGAMIVSGFSNSYLMLLLTRIALGAIVASAAPAVASLTGDLFPSYERGRIWGYVLAGELIGTAFGFVVSGAVAGIASWRAAFWLLGVLGLGLAGLVAWRLVEPERGGHARLPPYSRARSYRSGDESREAADTEKLAQQVDKYDIPPRDAQILKTNPANMSLWRAIVHVLSIRTNVLLIIASALGYFYFTGVRTFAVVFVSGRFGLAQSVASMVTVALGLGALLGVFISGRLADWLIKRDYIAARVVVGAGAFLLTAVFFLPGLFSATVYLTAPLFFLAAAGLGGTNPPLDAARLDIVHSRLWGRAESIRTTLRYIFEAAAPVTFGFISSLFGGHGSALGQAPESAQKGAQGLTNAFLILIVLMVIAAGLLFIARQSYPRDTATALASERALSSNDET